MEVGGFVKGVFGFLLDVTTLLNYTLPRRFFSMVESSLKKYSLFSSFYHSTTFFNLVSLKSLSLEISSWVTVPGTWLCAHKCGKIQIKIQINLSKTKDLKEKTIWSTQQLSVELPSLPQHLATIKLVRLASVVVQDDPTTLIFLSTSFFDDVFHFSYFFFI